MTVEYHIIGKYNHQSLSFEHVDDYLVTENSAIQRVKAVMNGKGILPGFWYDRKKLTFIRYDGFDEITFLYGGPMI